MCQKDNYYINTANIQRFIFTSSAISIIKVIIKTVMKQEHIKGDLLYIFHSREFKI